MFPRLVAALAAVVIVLLACAAPAWSHVDLIDTDPDEGAVLPVAPEELTLTFTEEVELVPGGVRLFDAAGTSLESTSSTSGTRVEVDVPTALTEGSYVLVWRVVSVDGHPRTGILTFAVGSASARVEAPDLVASERPWLTTVGSVVDALVYVGLLVALGLALFLVVVVPEGLRRPVWRRLRLGVTAAAVVGGVAALARIIVVTLDQNGLRPGDLGAWSAWRSAPVDAVLGSALLLLGLGLLQDALTPDHGEWRRRGVLAAGALAALAAPTLTGHTRSLDPAVLVAVVDMWHLLAGAVWLGGLLGLALAWRVVDRASWLAALTRFSALAAAVLIVLVPSGTLVGWRVVETWSALTDTGYGRVLLAKVAVVGVVVALAGWNRWILLPRAAATHLRRTVAVEAGLLLAVVGLTGALVNQSPRPALPDPRPVASVSATANLTTDLEVAVRVSPARVGVNDVRLVLQDRSGNAVEVSTTPRLVLTGPGGRSVRLADLAPADDGSFEGAVELPAAGRWRVEVRQRLDEFSEPSGTVVIDVAD